jgi:4-diphosphocytidyl-2-C-methyl-D-erythritol kinase
LVVFPNCKINIGLRVGNKRADGFHNVETIFFPIPLFDVQEVIAKPLHPTTDFQLFTTGLPIKGDATDNLCTKAYYLLKKDFEHIPAIELHLHKVVPMGGGLGGGSSDAAFTLLALNEKFNLNISTEKLQAYAGQLGSDCPFFITNKPSIALGRGEILNDISLTLKDYKIIIVAPNVHINTGWAFQQLAREINTEATVEASLFSKAIQLPIEEWRHHLVNDFEIPVFKTHPELEEIKKTLYNTRALYASMSGSGSCLFGIFEREENVIFPKNYHPHFSLTNLM